MADILSLYDAYAQENNEAPTRFHTYCGAAAVGTIIGRRIHLPMAFGNVYPALWVCLVGPSGVMKSSAINMALAVVSRTNEEWVLPNKFSVEKLYQILSEKDGLGIIAYREFNLLLASMSREFNSELKGTLTDWWDCPYTSSHATKGGGTVTVKNPAMTILAGSTPEWLTTAAQTKDIRGGFYPRWLYAIVERTDKESVALPMVEPDRKRRNSVVMHLQELMRMFREENTTKNIARFEQKAKTDYETLYDTERRKWGSHDLVWPFVRRGLNYVLRLAMISCLARRKTYDIAPDDITWAWELVHGSIMDVVNLTTYELADTKTDAHLNKLRKLLRNAGERGMTFRELQQRGPVRQSRWLQPLMHTLRELGDVQLVKEQKTQYFVLNENTQK